MKFFKLDTVVSTRDEALDKQWWQHFDLDRTANVIWTFTYIKKNGSGAYIVRSIGLKK